MIMILFAISVFISNPDKTELYGNCISLVNYQSHRHLFISLIVTIHVAFSSLPITNQIQPTVCLALTLTTSPYMFYRLTNRKTRRHHFTNEENVV